jgi:hypothetical protein
MFECTENKHFSAFEACPYAKLKKCKGIMYCMSCFLFRWHISLVSKCSNERGTSKMITC